MPDQANTVKTGVDLLIDLVKKEKSISLVDAAKKLDIPVQTLEVWAQFLEEEGELGVDYKFTTPFLTVAKEQKKDEDSKDRDYDLSGTSVHNQLNLVADLMPRAQDKLNKGKLKDAHQDFSQMMDSIKGLQFHTHGWFEKNKPEESEKIKKRIDNLTSGINLAGDLMDEGDMAGAKKKYEEKSKEIQALHSELAELYQQIKGDVEKELIQGIETGNIKTPAGLAPAPPPQKPTKVRIIHTQAKDFEPSKLFGTDEKVYVVEDEALSENQIPKGLKHVKAVHTRNAGSKLDNADSLFSQPSESEKREMKQQQKKEKDEERFKPKTDQDKLEMLAEETEQEEEPIPQIKPKVVEKLRPKADIVRELLKKEDIDGAWNVYKGLYTTFSKLPSAFIDKKNQLKNSILQVSSELYAKQKEVHSKKKETIDKHLKEVVKDIKNALKKNQYDEGYKLFEDAKKTLNGLPKGFPDDKRDFLKDLTGLFQKLLKASSEITTKDFENKKQEFFKQVTQMQELLLAKKIPEAKKLYAQLTKAYASMPLGFQDERLVMQEKILSSYKELILEEQKQILVNQKNLKDKLQSLIAEVKKDTRMKDLNAVEEEFTKLAEAFNQMSTNFIQDRREIQSNIIETQIGLQELRTAQYKKDMDAKQSELNKLFKRVQTFIKKEQFELANELFSKIVDLNNDLPPGFYDQKCQLLTQAYSLYKEFYEKLDKHMLENVDDETKVMYEKLLGALVRINEHIESGDLVQAAATYHDLVQIYTKLPVGFLLKNVKIKEEVIKIHEVYKLFKRLHGLEESLDKNGPEGLPVEIKNLKVEANQIKSRYKEDTMYFDRILEAIISLESRLNEALDSRPQLLPAPPSGPGEPVLDDESLPPPPDPASFIDAENPEFESYSSEDVKKSFKPVAPIQDLEVESNKKKEIKV